MFKNAIGFPEEVDEISARLVATGVVALTLVTLITRQQWMGIPLAIGFILRVLSGPRFSPLARFATGFVRPRLQVLPRPTPGAPKRFAQAIGATLSTLSLVLFLSGFRTAGFVAIGAILIAASLEAFAGYCLGCKIFGLLMKMGVIPETVCEACNNIYSRPAVSNS